MMVETLIVLGMGIADRWRGDAQHLISRATEKLLYCYLVALLAGHAFDALTLPLVAALFLGMSIGWGEPLGALLERRAMNPERFAWWQRGALLRRDALAAMIARGALWAAPVLPIALFDPALTSVALAFFIAVPLAPYLFRDWEVQEFVRGVLAGVMILTFNATGGS